MQAYENLLKARDEEIAAATEAIRSKYEPQLKVMRRRARKMQRSQRLENLQKFLITQIASFKDYAGRYNVRTYMDTDEYQWLSPQQVDLPQVGLVDVRFATYGPKRYPPHQALLLLQRPSSKPINLNTIYKSAIYQRQGNHSWVAVYDELANLIQTGWKCPTLSLDRPWEIVADDLRLHAYRRNGLTP